MPLPNPTISEVCVTVDVTREDVVLAAHHIGVRITEGRVPAPAFASLAYEAARVRRARVAAREAAELRREARPVPKHAPEPRPA